VSSGIAGRSELLDLIDATVAAGGRMFGQSHSRGISVVISFLTRLPFDRLPLWSEVRAQTPAEQLRALRDESLRRKLVDEAHHGDYGRSIGAETPAPDYTRMRVYNQPNKDLPGYNPNEEHALMVPSATGSLGLYALRNDLNTAINVSDPYALLKYRDPATRQWRMRAYRILAEDAPYFFNYPGEAGKEIQPPFPLSTLTICDSSYGVPGGGPWWEDVRGKIYARAAGPKGGLTNIQVRWFYPLQPPHG